MKKTWLKMVLVFVGSMVLLCSCGGGGGGSDDSSSPGAEQRLGIDGDYAVQFNLDNCGGDGIRAFDLEIGDQPNLSTRFGAELKNCYLYVPASDKSVTYIFTESGRTITRTVAVSGGDTVKIDDSWMVNLVQYTSNIELRFYPETDLKTFTISGSVNDDTGCIGNVGEGTGLKH
jgi:hypothetical protein